MRIAWEWYKCCSSSLLKQNYVSVCVLVVLSGMLGSKSIFRENDANIRTCVQLVKISALRVPQLGCLVPLSQELACKFAVGSIWPLKYCLYYGCQTWPGRRLAQSDSDRSKTTHRISNVFEKERVPCADCAEVPS